MSLPANVRAYSGLQWFGAVNIAAILGWALAFGIPTYVASIKRGQSINEVALAFAFMSFLVSLASCWIVAGPALKLIMQKSVTWLRAAIWGAILAVAVYFFNFLLLDCMVQFDIGCDVPSTDFSGITAKFRTLFGRGIENFFAYFVFIGIVVALTTRGFFGPGKLGELPKGTAK